MKAMKKIFSLILVGLALAACATKESTTAVTPSEDLVDLRYRVNDSYDLPCENPPAFTIIVKSNKPWSITSNHPTWCMIELEEGEAVADSLVHLGKGESTSVKVQYYDNNHLDDRVDTIVIASSYWVGKEVYINQKGNAYLTVDEAERDLPMTKAGEEVVFHIQSNQNWSVKPAEGSEWLNVTEGATGTMDGVVKVTAPDNQGEMRYGYLEILDRNGKKQKWQVAITQDGVQLEPVCTKVLNEDTRLYDLEFRNSNAAAGTVELSVKSNTIWTVAKKNASDTWFDLLDAGGTKDGTVRIQFTENTGEAIREGFIILNTVVDAGDAAVVTKEVKVRQACKPAKSHFDFTADELSQWSVTADSKWTGTPEAVDGGALLTSPTQMKRKMSVAGTYTIRWSNIGAGAEVVLWYVFSDSKELQFKISGGTASVSGGGMSGKANDVDLSVPHDMTVIATEGATSEDGGTTYCHLSVLFDGVEIANTDTSEDVFPACVMGSTMYLYLGVRTADSALLEWYEYTAPFSWE